jgi:uncharacterized protein (TIGR02598 family)
VRRPAAFSLIEVTIALGVIAIGFIAILGLVPLGLKSGTDSIDDTRVALIAKDVQGRAAASVTYAMFGSTNNVTLPTAFYDRDGSFVGNSVTGASIYRADATIYGNWTNGAPANLDGTVMRPAAVQIRWPLNSSNGSPLGTNSKSFSFYIRRP